VSENYTYSWIGEDINGNSIDLGSQNNNPDLNNLIAGSYQLTVYDSRLCAYETTIQVESPPEIEFSLSQPTDVSSICFDISCSEANDGWIDASSINSPADSDLGFLYTWTWNDVVIIEDADDPNIDGLSPGYYQLYVEDNLTGCENIFGPIFISEPPVLYSSIDNVFISDFDSDGVENDYNGYSTSCPGSLDGMIGVEIYGGSGYYNVAVLNSEGIPYLDSEGNEVSGDVELDPIPCELDILENLDIDGDGVNNFGPDGIEGNGDDDPDMDGDGEYQAGPDGVLDTDDDICVSNCNGVDSDIDGDGIMNSEDDDIDGDGILNFDDSDIDGDGVLNSEDDNMSGGSSFNNDNLPYYVGTMSEIVEIEGLGAGMYSIIINDGLCEPLDTIHGIELIDPPYPLSAEIMQTDSVSCYDDSDGSVLINFYGGLPNNWNWGLYDSEGDIVSFGANLIEEGDVFIENLSAGQYAFNIYDINGFYVTDVSQAYLGLSADEEYHYFNEGCSYVLDIVISQPDAIEMNIVDIVHPCFTYYNNDDFIDPSDGVMNLELTGGSDPLNLLLVNHVSGGEVSLISYANNQGVHVVQFSGLSEGDYDLLVTDINNCSQYFDSNDNLLSLGWNYVLDTEGVPSEIIVNHVDEDGDGFFDNLEMPDCEFSSDGLVAFPEIVNNNTAFDFNYFWVVNNDTMSTDSLSGLTIGLYSLNLNISNANYDCTLIYDYILEEEYDCDEIPTAFSPNGDGVNDYWVIGAMDEYIGAEVEVYNRWGQEVFYSPDNKNYWDGTWKGKNIPTADYFYIIKDSSGSTLSHGRVTLRR